MPLFYDGRELCLSELFTNFKSDLPSSVTKNNPSGATVNGGKQNESGNKRKSSAGRVDAPESSTTNKKEHTSDVAQQKQQQHGHDEIALKFSPELVAVAKEWTDKPVKVVDENVLYVSQREYTVVDSLTKGEIQYVATGDATTCHILILIHLESKAIGIAHYDGANTEQGTTDLLSALDELVVKDKSAGDVPPPRYEMYLFGGFEDPKGTSDKLSREVLGALSASPHQLEVKVLCIGKLNSRFEGSTPYPVFYGAGVDCNSLQVYNMRCTDKGPLQSVKGCRNFVGPLQMVNAYKNSTKEMVVEPFNYDPFTQIDLWLRQSDAFLLKYLSTSPEQEPSHFVSGVRASLRCMKQHPRPLVTLFKNHRTFTFTLSQGRWVQASP